MRRHDFRAGGQGLVATKGEVVLSRIGRARGHRGRRIDGSARRGWAVLALVWAIAGGVAASAYAASAPPPSSVANAAASNGSLTASQLSTDLRAAGGITKVPADLTPSLSTAAGAFPLIRDNGCELWIAGLRSKPCVYGDTNSHTSVVLFGDSHASTWFPALNAISKQRHWRLLIFTKAGCSPPVVTIVRLGVLYDACTTWRKNSEQQIAALHPALVIVTWARYLERRVTGAPGVPQTYNSAWQNGVAAIFRFLHGAAQRVIFISDVPTLKQGAPDCVSRHLSDVRPCNSTPRRIAIVLPTVRHEELQIAGRTHIDSIDPIPWFCAPTVCPMIVDHFILYRDTSHMTPEWSQFIAPVLAASMTSIMHDAPVSR